MKRLTIDLESNVVEVEREAGESTSLPLSSPEAFAAVSKAWLRAGWDAKYVYSFTWLGRPIIQLPDDLMRLQEVIFQVAPDVIVETGVAHGGSLIFHASICKALGKGRVLGIDVEIRPHNRRAIEAHPLSTAITLIEGDTVAPQTVERVSRHIQPGETVLLLLDSCHTKEHVLAELEAYSSLVSVGSYAVAMDGIMGEVAGAPRTDPDWTWNNPCEAVRDFLARHPDFALVEPPFLFNEGSVKERVTYWPNAFLKRVAQAPV